MQLNKLKRRIARLEKPGRGLDLEGAPLKGADDSLLDRERRAYLDPVQDALPGRDGGGGQAAARARWG